MSDIAAAIPLFACLSEQADTQFPGAPERLRFWECQRQLINVLVGGLIEGTTAAAEQAGVQDVNDVRQHRARLAQMSRETGELNCQIKRLLTEKLYLLDRLTQERALAAEKIGALFALFSSLPERLPVSYQEQLADWPVERVVCDYIAGMTDAYFLRVYGELLAGNRV
jgi:dGTPase